jgi:U3 small nucleolar RNA-associated protein 12
VELFRIRTEEEAKKKQARKKKRDKEKTKGKGSKDEENAEVNGKPGESQDDLNLEDLFSPYLVVRASGKIRSFSFCDEAPGPKGDIQVCLDRVYPEGGNADTAAVAIIRAFNKCA